MSERMIELQRAKLGLPTPGGTPVAPIHKSAQSAGKSSLSPQARGVGGGSGGRPSTHTTSQQAAAASIHDEDTLMQRFIQRLQRRDDSHPITSASGPTVPTALSRRLLQRQGVGYLDDTVAAIASASADRFLATVLQQAVACRDQRLKGAEMTREATRQLKRHIQNYQADTDDRKRRKEENENAREKYNLAAISAAEALKKGGTGSKDAEEKKSKKKKKKEAEESATNGMKKLEKPKIEDDENSYDSIDEEEEYYRDHMVSDPQDADAGDVDDDDDDDDMLLLRDLVRPLEAWDFHVTGKDGLEVYEKATDEEEVDHDLEEDIENGGAAQSEENVFDDSAIDAGADSSRADSKQNDDGEKLKKKASTSATSQAPNAS